MKIELPRYRNGSMTGKVRSASRFRIASRCNQTHCAAEYFATWIGRRVADRDPPAPIQPLAISRMRSPSRATLPRFPIQDGLKQCSRSNWTLWGRWLSRDVVKLAEYPFQVAIDAFQISRAPALVSKAESTRAKMFGHIAEYLCVFVLAHYCFEVGWSTVEL